MSFYFVDVSAFQPAINYQQLAAGGIQGVVCKATEGTASQTFQSTYDYFNRYASAAKGMFPIQGAYHYLRAGNARAQVHNFLSTVTGAFGSLDGLVIQLDAEDPQLTLSDVNQWRIEWNAATRSYPYAGYYPRWFWEGKGVAPTSLLSGVAAWWQSAYVNGTGTYQSLATEITSGWNTWGGFSPTILQYTSSARVPGIGGLSDVNQVRLSMNAFLHQCTRVPTPPPLIGVEMALVQVSGSNAVYWTNGASKRVIPSMAILTGGASDISGATIHTVSQAYLDWLFDLDATPASA